MHNYRWASRGVSLMELLIVVVIISILVGVGIPKWAEFINTTSVSGTFNATLVKVREGQQLAMARRQNVYFWVDYDNNEAFISLDSGGMVAPGAPRPYGTKVVSNKGVEIFGSSIAGQNPGSGKFTLICYTVHKTAIIDPGPASEYNCAGNGAASGDDVMQLHIGRTGSNYADVDANEFRTVETMRNMTIFAGFTEGCGSPFSTECKDL